VKQEDKNRYITRRGKFTIVIIKIKLKMSSLLNRLRELKKKKEKMNTSPRKRTKNEKYRKRG
jgi:hypothetical protein